MKRLHQLMLLLTAAIAIYGCGGGDDAGPTGPTIQAPTTLTAVPLSDSAIQLDWDDATALETGYRVFHFTDGIWAPLPGDLPANSRTFTHAGLTEGTAKSYRVKAITPTSESAFSPTAHATTLPKSPGGLTAIRLSGQSVEVTWGDSSAIETGYELQRKLRQENTFATIATLDANVVSYTDNGLTPNTTYNYRVRALRDTVGSAWTRSVSVTTVIYTPPAPVALNAIDITANGCILRWTDVGTNEDGFVIEQSLSADGGWNFKDSLKSPDRQQYPVTGLTSSTTYWFRVFAYNDSGLSLPSNSVEVTTMSGPPVAPSELAAEAVSYRRVNLNWRDNSVDEDGFYLERKEPPSTIWTRLDTLDANVIEYVDSAIVRIKTYTYRIAAWSENGISGWSNEATVTTPDGPPNAPSRLNGQGIALDKIRLNWQDNSTNEEGFFVERKGPGEPDFTPINTTPSGFATYTDTGLAAETEYTYRVKAFNRLYESNYSNEATVSTWSLTALFDDFEGYAEGAPPSRADYRINLAGNSRIVVSTADRHNGQKSLLFVDPDADNTSLAQLFVTHRNLHKGRITMWLRMAVAGHFGVIGSDPNNTITFRIQFNEDNTYFIQDGGSLIVGGSSFPTNRWMQLEIEFDLGTGLWSLSFDGNQVNSDMSLLLADGHPSANQLVFTCYRNAEIDFVYLDELNILQILDDGAPRPVPTTVISPESTADVMKVTAEPAPAVR